MTNASLKAFTDFSVRPFVQTDNQRLREMLQSPALRSYLHSECFTAEGFIDAVQPHAARESFAVVDKHDSLIGVVTFFKISPSFKLEWMNKGEVAMSILIDPAYHRKGIGMMALACTMHSQFVRQAKLQNIYAFAAETNTASNGLLRQSGFKFLQQRLDQRCGMDNWYRIGRGTAIKLWEQRMKPVSDANPLRPEEVREMQVPIKRAER